MWFVEKHTSTKVIVGFINMSTKNQLTSVKISFAKKFSNFNVLGFTCDVVHNETLDRTLTTIIPQIEDNSYSSPKIQHTFVGFSFTFIGKE